MSQREWLQMASNTITITLHFTHEPNNTSSLAHPWQRRFSFATVMADMMDSGYLVCAFTSPARTVRSAWSTCNNVWVGVW